MIDKVQFNIRPCGFKPSFIAGGWGRAEDLRMDQLIFRRTKGGMGSVVTENPKGGITENFGRNQRGNHSHLLGK